MISGYVFDDANGNGIMDPGEVGRVNVEVILEKLGGQGDYDRTATRRTDAEGWYIFTEVEPGSYRVRALLPGELVQTTKADQEGVYLVSVRDATRFTNRDFGTERSSLSPEVAPAVDAGDEILSTAAALAGTAEPAVDSLRDALFAGAGTGEARGAMAVLTPVTTDAAVTVQDVDRFFAKSAEVARTAPNPWAGAAAAAILATTTGLFLEPAARKWLLGGGRLGRCLPASGNRPERVVPRLGRTEWLPGKEGGERCHG